MQELWTELLAHWMAADWLAGWQLDGWMDAGWPSGRPEGPQDPENLPGWWLSASSWGPTVSIQEAYILQTTYYRLQDARPRPSCRLQDSRTVKTEMKTRHPFFAA